VVVISSDAVMTVAFFGAVASVAWSAAFAWAKWLTHRHDARPLRGAAGNGVDGSRIARLEVAVETLAVELERLGEGQRYVARLLDERLPPAIAPSREAPSPELGRVTTPH
jgi:hypothetical protein